MCLSRFAVVLTAMLLGVMSPSNVLAAVSAPPQQHVFYRDAQGAIHHVFLDGTSNRLLHDQWTDTTDPAAVGDPAVLVMPGQQHVFYRDGKGVIRHIFFDEVTNQLYRDDWTQRAGAPTAAGDPITMVTEHQQHVFYRDYMGAIQQIIFDDRRDPGAPLLNIPWTEKTDPPAAGDPATMQTPGQQHIFYRDNFGAIRHVFFDERADKLFRDNWTGQANAPAAAGDPVTMVAANQQHIFYRDTYGNIQHIFVNDKGKFFTDQWTLPQGRLPVTAVGNPATMVTAHQQHIFYRDSHGDVNYVFVNDNRKPGTPFFRDNWTHDADAPAAIGDAITMVTEHQQHIFYRDSQGAITHIIADDRRKKAPLYKDNWIQDTDARSDAGRPVATVTPASESSHNVITQRNNNQRTSASNWAGFNQSSFASGHFGRLDKVIQVSGSVVAQPLFIESVPFADGLPPSDAIFISTSLNKIYAFAADPPFKQRWMLDLGQPYTMSGDQTLPDKVKCAWPLSDHTEKQLQDNDSNRVLGIEATPAIDPVLHRMYISYRNNVPPKGTQRIAALDITTGRLLPNHEPFNDAWTQEAHRPAALGNPVTMLTPEQQHVFYRDKHGDIQHIFVNAKNQFFHDVWTQNLHVRKAAGDPATMQTANQQHIFYRDANGDIQHIFVNQKNQFFADVWTQKAAKKYPGVGKAAGDPVTMLTDNQQHIFYRDTDGDIQHIFVDQNNHFFHDVWTQRAQTKAGIIRKASGDPVTMQTANQQHIFYRDTDGDIQHIFVDQNNQYFHDVWTQRAAAKNPQVRKAAGDPVTMVTNNEQHVFYRDTNGDIQHMFVDQHNQFFQDVWTQRAQMQNGNILKAAGDPVTMQTADQQHIFYRDTSGNIQHIFVNQSNQFFADVWTQRAHAPTAAGDPATMLTTNQQHVFYRDRNGDIRHIFFDETSLQDHDVNTDQIWNQLHRSRASLLLDHGLVYLGFGALCEPPNTAEMNGGIYAKKTYQGWVYAFDSNTLGFAGRYRTVHDPKATDGDPADDKIGGGGIWQASTGLAADLSGNLLFASGNQWKGNDPRYSRPPDASGTNLSSSVVRLRVSHEPGRQPNVTLAVSDWFTPYRKVWQDQNDMDLGSGGVVLIPHSPYAVAGGKEGMLYLLDQRNLGKFDDRQSFVANDVMGGHGDPTGTHGWASLDKPDDKDRDYVPQKFLAATNEYCANQNDPNYCFVSGLPGLRPPFRKDKGVSMDHWAPSPHIHGTAVFGDFGQGVAYLYVWPEKDYLKAFEWSWTTHRFIEVPRINKSVLTPPFFDDHQHGPYGMPGGMLALSIDPLNINDPSHLNSGVLFASVQRCRRAGLDEGGFSECSVTLCKNPDNCRNQDYGMLRAFDPMTLKELWNNQMDPIDPERDYFFAKFVPPTIAHGRVYLATGSDKILVYGQR